MDYQCWPCACPVCRCLVSPAGERPRVCASCRSGRHDIDARAAFERAEEAKDAADPAVRAHFDTLRDWTIGELVEAFGR